MESSSSAGGLPSTATPPLPDVGGLSTPDGRSASADVREPRNVYGFGAVLPPEDGPYTQHVDARTGILVVRDRIGRERLAIAVGMGDDSRISPSMAEALARALVLRVLLDGEVVPVEARENETFPAALAFAVSPARRGTYTVHRSEVFGEAVVRDALGNDRLTVWVDWRRPFTFTRAEGAALSVELVCHLGTESDGEEEE